MRTTLGEIAEDRLIERKERTEVGSQAEDYHAIAVATEYCLRECEGAAHKTGVPDGPGVFCKHHVRRDVDVKVLKLPENDALAQALR